MKSIQDRSLRWKIGIPLAILLILLTVVTGGVWWISIEQQQDGAAIDKAGEQRLLTQMMVWEAHQVAMGNDDYREHLSSTATEFDQSLKALKTGDDQKGLPEPPEEAYQQFRAVEQSWEPFYQHVEIIVTEDQESPEFAESIEYIEHGNQDLLLAADEAVTAYEAAFERKVQILQLTLTLTFASGLIVVPSLFLLIDWEILKPLRRVTLQSHDVAEGDYDEQISIPNRDDEIGTLSRSVREMKEQLTSTIRERERFRHAIENAGHAIYITDADKTIQYVNPAFEEITGYSAEVALGKDPSIWNSGKHSDAFFEDLWTTVKSGEVWEGEVINERYNGERFHAVQTIAPVHTANDAVTAYVAIMADETDRLIQSQQNDVYARMSRHNLRNEITVILGHIEELRTAQTTDQREKHANKAQEAGDRLLNHSEKARKTVDLLNSDDTWASQPVCETTQSVITQLEDRYPEAQIEVDLPDIECEVPVNIEILIEELVSNAIEHHDKETPGVEVRIFLNDENEVRPSLSVVVIDDGPGINATEAKVLEKGSESALEHGSGIGIWLVHWVTMLIGGEINIIDRYTRGTKIELRLPRASLRPFPLDSDRDVVDSSAPSNQNNAEH